MRLILVRHAETTSNLTMALDTLLPGADLTERGRDQLVALGAALARERIEAVFASPARRTTETALAIATPRRLPVRELSGLREISAGDYEMRDDAESIAAYLETVANYGAGIDDVLLPRGETRLAVFERFDAAVDEVASSGVDAAAIVSHGAVLRAWCSVRVEGLVGRDSLEPLGNAHRGVIDGDPASGWTVESWNVAPTA